MVAAVLLGIKKGGHVEDNFVERTPKIIFNNKKIIPSTKKLAVKHHFSFERSIQGCSAEKRLHDFTRFYVESNDFKSLIKKYLLVSKNIPNQIKFIAL